MPYMDATSVAALGNEAVENYKKKYNVEIISYIDSNGDHVLKIRDFLNIILNTQAHEGKVESFSDNGNLDSFRTWSYYSDEETFRKFLGQTSYYLGLQNNLCKIIKLVGTTSILELGFGTGHTAIRVANENPQSKVTVIDIRPKMVDVGKKLAAREKAENVSFAIGDMVEYVKSNLNNFDFIYLLYNFHHIEDKADETNERGKNTYKYQFLRDCYDNMKVGAYICIAELFISNDESETEELFKDRILEGYASTFWNSLTTLDEEAISEARRSADFCKNNEHEIGIKVRKREHEYPVTREWLKRTAKQLRFREVLCENINVVGDAIMLFKKV